MRKGVREFVYAVLFLISAATVNAQVPTSAGLQLVRSQAQDTITFNSCPRP